MAPRSVLVAGIVCYLGLTALVGRNVLAHLFTGVVHDLGDPLFTATILEWSTRTTPLSDAWWQFPAFYPTADAMTFSEHLLGISVLATPLTWMLGDAIAASNLVTLLTFPLCAITMASLVYRITRDGAAAFVAGLMFGFSPYRMGQVTHLQVLALFWVPLALLGLHGYAETGRRGWLWLLGAAFLLQGASNLYSLLFLSVLMALWIGWFAAARGSRFAVAITAPALAAGALQLPVLLKYHDVHLRHQFTRSLWEVEQFSADLMGLACAPPDLALWGWLRLHCRPEGELFPGLAAVVVLATGVWRLARTAGGAATSSAGLVAWVHAAAWIAAGLFGATAASVFVFGPWSFDAGLSHVSVGSADKPFVIAVGAVALASLTSRGLQRAVKTRSPLGFYVLATAVMWLLALGPSLWVAGVRRNSLGLLPFGWLMQVPGMDGLRVPARAWMMATCCLAVVAGLVVSRAGRWVPVRRIAFAAGLTALVMSDSWVRPFESVAIIRQAPAPEQLRGHVVLTLPLGGLSDIVAQHEAVRGGWRSVNGYSGYEPARYKVLRSAAASARADLFEPFRRHGDLYVVVSRHEPHLLALVMRQDGATRTAESSDAAQFRLPQRR